VDKIAEFLDRSLSEQQISHVVQQTRFDAMNQDPDVYAKSNSRILKVEATKSLFFRKGMYTVTAYPLAPYCRSKLVYSTHQEINLSDKLYLPYNGSIIKIVKK